MPLLELKPRAKKAIEFLPPKHKEQIKKSILALQKNPHPHDARRLIGYADYIRMEVGEYRIMYRHEKKMDLVVVVISLQTQ